MSRKLSSEEIGTIIFKNKGLCLNNLRKHIYNESEIDDAFMDCTLKLLSKNEIDEEGAKRYILTCFKNFGIDNYRKTGKNLRPVELDAARFIVDDDEEEAFFIVNDEIDTKEYAKSLLSKVHLSQFASEIINLRFNEGLKFHEIAERLRTDKEDVKNNYFSAIRRFQRFINRENKRKKQYTPFKFT